eukprot:TRINITY_DN10735_c0_g1_i1.p1 TRINITY_DN10735_c0_g1~~TRINITY_DN10735_c0_g1_i1.p1  ORF type:complete len:271 (+),score=92.06 TRINITY_DN10735_c0_g1_i1:91-813(+)
MDDLKIIQRPSHFELKLWPIPDAPEENKVGIQMEVKLPPGYPNEAPDIMLRSLRGVSGKTCIQLEESLRTEIQQRFGEQMIFVLTSIVKEYLDSHNDTEEDLGIPKNDKVFSQYEITAAEKDGTPVTTETFQIWWTEFRKELEQKKRSAGGEVRLTGRELFAQSGSTALVAPDTGSGAGDSTDIDWELFAEEEGDDVDIEDIEDDDVDDEEVDFSKFKAIEVDEKEFDQYKDDDNYDDDE